MLATIKKILLDTSGNKLAEYYQSRLQQTRCAVEVEAILTMGAIMTFDEESALQSELSK